MVEFKDDGTATTPGKPRENRDAESAVVADLVAVELDDAGLNLNAKRLPILARIYGAVVLLDGLATLPIMVISILYAVREILDGHVHVDAMSLTFILSAIHAVVLVVSAACLIVLGVMLLRNHRRYAARWTYVLMPLTLADGMLSLALTGLGFNLLLPLGDFDETVRQGVNGVIFALLALDSGGYEIPEAPEAETQATRELYVGELLRREIPDGGWALTGGTPDADMTAMALQALAKYRDRQDVEDAVQRGLAALSALQEPNGAYLSWDEENSESVCQVIVALTELGISLDDERFVKNGQTLPQVLERFACEDGSYRHSLNGNSDEMATEQAFYALAAIHRAETGKTTLYDMTDVMQ